MVIIIKDIQADELSSMSDCSTAESEIAERVKRKIPQFTSETLTHTKLSLHYSSSGF